jgi:hypothetical protein
MAEFASKGVAGAGLGLGIAGTALGLLNNSGSGLFGLGNNSGNNVVADELASALPFMAGTMVNGGFGRNNGGQCFQEQFVNHYELETQNQLAQKDSEIAMLKADQTTDTKLLELYKYVDTQFKEIRQENCDRGQAQAVINAQVSDGLGIATNNIASLSNTINSLTKVVIPNANVCPGWGTVSVVPTGSSTVVGYDCNTY